MGIRDCNYRDTSVGLEGWREQKLELQAAYLALLNPLDVAQWSWRPARDRWSILEVVDHVNKTSAELIPALQRTMDSARRSGTTGQPPFAYSGLGRWFLGQVAPPAKRAVPAPKLYRPRLELDPARVTAELSHLTTAYIDLLRAAESLHLARIQMRSPAMWLLRLPVGVWLATVVAHDARHLAQVRAVRAQENFPARGA